MGHPALSNIQALPDVGALALLKYEIDATSSREMAAMRKRNGGQRCYFLERFFSGTAGAGDSSFFLFLLPGGRPFFVLGGFALSGIS